MDTDLRIAYDHLVRRGGGRGPPGYVLTGERGTGLTVRRRPRRRVDLHVDASGRRHRFALLPTGSFVEVAWPPGEGPWVAEYHPDRVPPEIVLADPRGDCEILHLPETLAERDLSPTALPAALAPLTPLDLQGVNGLRATLDLGEYVGVDLSLRTRGATYHFHWTDVWQDHLGSPAGAVGRAQPIWFRSYRQGPHQWLEVRVADEVVDRFDVTAS
jgi:hypothetical protein